jgi:FkbM family methyltransferase
MLNEKVGSLEKHNGISYIRTNLGARGHALWGKHTSLYPGRYCVAFDVRAVHPEEVNRDEVYAVADLAARSGSQIISTKRIVGDELKRSDLILVEFKLDEPTIVEARLYTVGKARLLVADLGEPIPLSDATTNDDLAAIQSAQFPDSTRPDLPVAFTENVNRLGWLYQRGVRVNIVDGEVVLTAGAVKLRIRDTDDMSFIGDIFLANQYNLVVSGDLCIIDIGMNAGLASLFFAQRTNVMEVHAFEPFTETFNRAVGNLQLNPGLANKISANNFGRSDHNENAKIFLSHHTSGAYSVVGAKSGREVEIEIRDATEVLQPVIDAFKKIKSRKRHVAVDTLGLPIECQISPADMQDRDALAPVLRQVRRKSPFVTMSFVDSATTATRRNAPHSWRAGSPSPSSSAMTSKSKASSSCPSAGSSNGPSDGSTAPDASPRISRPPSSPPSHRSSSQSRSS